MVSSAHPSADPLNLVGNTFLFYKNQVEVWEAVVTFLLFPLLVGLAYWADKGFPLCWKKPSTISVTAANGKEIELASINSGESK